METTLIELIYSQDTFFLLMSGALVMWMAAGFAMLESGMVRTKSVAEILTKNIALYSIACLMYLFMGYNIMYGDSDSAWIPSLSFFLDLDNSLAEVVNSGGETRHSNMADFFFQVVFVATAMSIVSGSVAERMKLWAFLAFAVVMTGVIYPVEGYWKWGGGVLDKAGFLDFAGSGVVHLAGASAALAGVLLLGPRKGKYVKTPGGRLQPMAIPGSNMTFATLGTLILWLGWFGFNGGSQLTITSVADANAVSLIFVNTNIAAAGGCMAALALSRFWFGKTDLTMGLNGILAGLVAITAEPFTPTPGLAAFIGMVAGLLVVVSIIMLDRVAHIDDPVGAISVHGVSALWGLFAVVLSNPEASLAAQLEGIALIFVWTFGASFLTWMALKKTVGIRLSELDEYEGADIAEIGLEAYPEFTQKL
ncbi:MAG: ammonium transporter [Gammaproteobacteria bacterium]|nr:MAG: ammonium transporter [Gammaproteobacteria bacterium]RTZ59341.1 MAG: ammonium transporter [Gammaproteobacteria bacterium]